MYADIGPLSIKRQPCISTLNQDDQRVEYALLNYQVQKNEISTMSQKMDNAPGMDMTSPAGTLIFVI